MTPQSLLFAVSWAIRWYQICEGGVWVWVLFVWVGCWVGKKLIRRWKERRG